MLSVASVTIFLLLDIYLGTAVGTNGLLKRHRREEALHRRLDAMVYRIGNLETDLLQEKTITRTLKAEVERLHISANVQTTANARTTTTTTHADLEKCCRASENAVRRVADDISTQLKTELREIKTGLVTEKLKTGQLSEALGTCKGQMEDFVFQLRHLQNSVEGVDLFKDQLNEVNIKTSTLNNRVASEFNKLRDSMLQLGDRQGAFDETVARLGGEVKKSEGKLSTFRYQLIDVMTKVAKVNNRVVMINGTLTNGLAELNKTVEELKTNCCHGPTPAKTPGDLPPPRDCWDLRRVYNITKDGVYQILSPRGMNETVLCDMTTDGGGWTIFQRRYMFNAAVNFSQPYSTYEFGFGDLKSDFWMGNDFLHQFTAYEKQTLRVDLCDKNNQSKHAIYDSFAVASHSDCFRLHVAGYHGDAEDALIKGFGTSYHHHGQCFSTHDKDQDMWEHNSCARQQDSSGWWYNACYSARLNMPHEYNEEMKSQPMNVWKPGMGVVCQLYAQRKTADVNEARYNKLIQMSVKTSQDGFPP